jgi:hypothetical protein
MYWMGENMKSIPQRFLIVLILFFGIANTSTGAPHEKYREVRIHFQNKDQVRDLARAGVIFDHVKFKKDAATGFFYTTVVNESEYAMLSESALPVEVLKDDIIADYQQRQRAKALQKQSAAELGGLDHFELGSMGGNYTFDEVVAELDSMRLLYPDLISIKESVGKSIENRDLWLVRISDNPDLDEEEPEAFYTGLHHAREPQGMMTVVYYMWHLLENYGTDPEITWLTDNRELYFLPVVNPDGYVYNQTTNPNGGGQWRKNRRNNGHNQYGVDLNRNYGYMWGYDNVGSSDQPWSETYRGASAFSEPETQIVRDLCQNHNFTAALNYHSYSNLLIYPWGYDEQLLTPDSVIYCDYARKLTEDNNYLYGTSDETVQYLVNGDSDDWMYGEQGTKNKIFAFTPEVGSDEDNFWPDEDRIIPLAQENLSANIYLAWISGGMARLIEWRLITDANENGRPDAGEQCSVVLDIRNQGLTNLDGLTLSLRSDDAYVSAPAGQQQVVQMDAQSVISTDSFIINIDEKAPQGHLVQLYLDKDYGGLTISEMLPAFVIGTPEILFADDAENGMTNWTSNQNWGVTQRYSVSGSASFTDSPDGKYSNNSQSYLQLAEALTLPSASAIYLEFRSRWYTEQYYDFLQVEASTDNTNWTALPGYFTATGSGQGVQSSSEQGYDGLETDWIREQIDLASYSGAANFYLRFLLSSDGGSEKDGWYLDDIRILSYDKIPSGIASKAVLPGAFGLGQNYPNPFNSQTVIEYTLPASQPVDLRIYNTAGEEVALLMQAEQSAGRHQILYNGAALASGLYYYVLRSADGLQTRKMLLIK